jgi:hypothetical protein
MHISLKQSRETGFLKWSSAAHRPANDDGDNSGGATPIALRKPIAQIEAPICLAAGAVRKNA